MPEMKSTMNDMKWKMQERASTKSVRRKDLI